jgi:hypothetical protein
MSSERERAMPGAVAAPVDRAQGRFESLGPVVAAAFGC